MRFNHINSTFTILIILTILGCQNKPKVIEIKNKSKEVLEKNSKDQSQIDSREVSNSSNNEVHLVKIKDKLETERYSYLKVQENGGPFYWIAVSK